MTDITELAQSLKAAAEKATPGEWRRASTQFNGITATPFMLGRKEVMIAGVSEKRDAEFIALANPANVLALVEALDKAQQRIAELENNEVREEGNQFLVVRHPGKVPVIKHPVGELEDYLRQIFKADPFATIDIVTHRYYGVGGQFVKDADEYLHEMSVKVEAE
ncbi:TPA: ead/Ea22-like family protein [Klebsiella quasipneumoniae]